MKRLRKMSESDSAEHHEVRQGKDMRGKVSGGEELMFLRGFRDVEAV